MQEMTAAEYRGLLLDQVRTASLATVRADRRPHVVPVWFDLDGDVVVFTTGEASVRRRTCGASHGSTSA